MALGVSWRNHVTSEELTCLGCSNCGKLWEFWALRIVLRIRRKINRTVIVAWPTQSYARSYERKPAGLKTFLYVLCIFLNLGLFVCHRVNSFVFLYIIWKALIESNPCRTAVNPNHHHHLDLSTLNHIKCRILQGHSLDQVWTLWGSLSYAPTISVKNSLIDPVTLTFDLSTPNPCHFYYIPSLKVLGSFVFSYAADRQTDKQTDGLDHPTHTDRQSRFNV